jgi:hypothetical protein
VASATPLPCVAGTGPRGPLDAPMICDSTTTTCKALVNTVLSCIDDAGCGGT